ncbi:MAG TPA: hypothetical protein DCR35_07010, partial [Runella sp.]|nr:hypothetical protein [Runella sp.]
GKAVGAADIPSDRCPVMLGTDTPAAVKVSCLSVVGVSVTLCPKAVKATKNRTRREIAVFFMRINDEFQDMK